MGKYEKDNKILVSLSVAIIPALIAALAGIVGSVLSYKLGTAPLIATQTAEAKQVTLNDTSPAKKITDIPIAISAQKGWQSTGIMLDLGDKVDITVSNGLWSTKRELLPESERALLSNDYRSSEIFVNGAFEQNGSGYTLSCVEFELIGCPIPDEKWGKLIARIGLNTPFEIGSQKTFVAISSGILELRINERDSSLTNNSGILAIVVKIEKQ